MNVELYFANVPYEPEGEDHVIIPSRFWEDIDFSDFNVLSGTAFYPRSRHRIISHDPMSKQILYTTIASEWSDMKYFTVVLKNPEKSLEFHSILDQWSNDNSDAESDYESDNEDNEDEDDEPFYSIPFAKDSPEFSEEMPSYSLAAEDYGGHIPERSPSKRKYEDHGENGDNFPEQQSKFHRIQGGSGNNWFNWLKNLLR